MSTPANPLYQDEIYYPESDGLPMADNTQQFEWIVTIKEGLDVMLPNDFVGGNIFWYPIEKMSSTKQSPDILVALGRPKGDRSSYKQWEEDGVAPQVVFEILSPGNSYEEMRAKEEFYEHHGIEEYYIYSPQTNTLFGWERVNQRLQKINLMQGWVSPRLGIRFERTPETLHIYRPDGERFLTFAELDAERRRERAEKEAAQAVIREQQVAIERLKQQLRELGHNPD